LCGHTPAGTGCQTAAPFFFPSLLLILVTITVLLRFLFMGSVFPPYDLPIVAGLIGYRRRPLSIVPPSLWLDSSWQFNTRSRIQKAPILSFFFGFFRCSSFFVVTTFHAPSWKLLPDSFWLGAACLEDTCRLDIFVLVSFSFLRLSRCVP